jgi:hypothetical protein
MRKFQLLSACAALSLLAVATSARAQTADDRDDYHFEDDDLVGDTLSSPPPLLHLRTGKLPRIMLLRPRASFVAELLKSCEAL